MKYEQKTLFPYVESLLAGNSTNDYNVETFSKHHGAADKKLRELKLLIIKYLPQDGLHNNQLTATLHDIYENEVWGDWLRQGYSRFPENFMVNEDVTKQLMFYGRSFGLSLCHGANGAPPVVLAAYGIFGFSQNDQKPNEYILSPNLLNLDWAKGRIPVKEGFIHISLTKNGTSEIEIPVGCQLTINYGGKTQVFKKAGKHRLT